MPLHQLLPLFSPIRHRLLPALSLLAVLAALALAVALPLLTPPPTWAQAEPTPAPNPAQAEPTPAPNPAQSDSPTATPVPRVDYDTDDDALIEVNSLLQLDAIRFDLDGNGVADAPKGSKGPDKGPNDTEQSPNGRRYRAAFPDAADNMGCPSSGCAGYELTANLTFDTDGDNDVDINDGEIYWNNGAGWTPIGSAEAYFNADFDGNFHTISRLFANNSNTNAIGLFGVSSGEIQKLYLTNVNIAGSAPAQAVGGLVGYNDSGEIRIVEVNGQVSAAGANADVGGLVGRSNRGFIHRGAAEVAVSSSGYKASAGGLVGASNRSDIQDSYAEGAVSVSNRAYAGGLVGYNNRGTVTTSSASGPVDGSRAGEYIRLGGLVGYSKYGIIAEGYASGPVTANGSSAIAGGLVSVVDWATIAACYASGAVSATGTEPSVAGGLVGYFLGDENLGGRIEASYARSRVSQNAPTSEIFVPGGLVGLYLGGDVINSYWDTEASGQSASGAGIGKTTAELQAEVTYSGIYDDWNLDFDGDGATDNPWKFPQSQYPDTRRTAPVN